MIIYVHAVHIHKMFAEHFFGYYIYSGSPPVGAIVGSIIFILFLLVLGVATVLLVLFFLRRRRNARGKYTGETATANKGHLNRVAVGEHQDVKKKKQP